MSGHYLAYDDLDQPNYKYIRIEQYELLAWNEVQALRSWQRVISWKLEFPAAPSVDTNYKYYVAVRGKVSKARFEQVSALVFGFLAGRRSN